MHILNKLFSKVFVITIGTSNERYDYISSYLTNLNINYELRVSVNKNFFESIYQQNEGIGSDAELLDYRSF